MTKSYPSCAAPEQSHAHVLAFEHALIPAAPLMSAPHLPGIHMAHAVDISLPTSTQLASRLGDSLDLVHDGRDVDRLLGEAAALSTLPLQQLQHARVVQQQLRHGRLHAARQ
jgi:hypothetical protein